jgi:hypothetical protein
MLLLGNIITYSIKFEDNKNKNRCLSKAREDLREERDAKL